jgi:Flp pilus assembly protein TadG
MGRATHGAAFADKAGQGVGRGSGRATRLVAGETGAAAIEFALTIPFVLSLLFGIIDFSRMTFSQAALNFAAEEATRFAVVREGVVSDDDIRAFAEQTLVDVFGLSEATFTVDTICCRSCPQG